MEPVYQISDDFVPVTKSTILFGYNTIFIKHLLTKKQIDKQHLKRKNKQSQAQDERNRISRCHL